MTIDVFAQLKTLVERAPFLAQWLPSMCALLTQAAELTEAFCIDQDESLGHLEANLQKPLATLKAQLLERAVQRKADQTPPQCPVCARKLTRRRKVERTIHTLSGDIKVTRVLGWCSKCKKWFCPGDEAMGVESGYSPAVQEAAALFASKMPLSEASKVIEHVLGIKLPPATLDRVAKQAAEKARQKRRQADEQARLGKIDIQGHGRAPDTLVIMMDAWNIRERDDFGRSAALRKKGLEPQRWHWVWTGTVFGLEQRVSKNERPLILHRGYVATREGMDSFAKQLHAEALRHGLGRAKRVLVMGDGGLWIWNIAKDRFKEAAQRIDLYHVKQHLWTVARELHQEPAAQALWVRKMKHRLRKGRSGKVIAELEQAIQQLNPTRQESARKELHYFQEHQARMTYAEAEKLHEPSGTGAMESTCRQYQCRFKRPGQFWSQQGDEALLCLDTFWRNGRWNLLFPFSKNFDPSKN
jgi:hypothetical protein